jgi:hypothetical protein
MCHKKVTTTWISYFYMYSKINQMRNISNLFYFGNNTLHVSDGLSVHHQESKTTYSIRYMYSLRLLMMGGKTVQNM